MPDETENRNDLFPNRPADKNQWWIEHDRLCIPTPDGVTITHCTREYVEDVLRQHNDLLSTVRDLEQELNRCEPDRFLPELLKKLESNSMTAMAANDMPRAEVYSVCSVMIRRFLSDDAERNGKKLFR